MAFATFCTNKGCGQHMEPYIDKEDKVYCSLCDQELSNITYFTKVQMKNFKQFKTSKKVAFAFKCNNCKKEDVPKLLQDKIVCPTCQKEHTNLSEPFKLMLKNKLKNINQDI